MHTTLTDAERIADRGDPGHPTIEPGPFAAIRKLVRNNPGLDAYQLADAGWISTEHGSLRHANDAGAITWRDGGWYVD